jgi:thymidylate synthase
MLPRTKDIREQLLALLAAQHFVTDKTGVKTIELIGATFIADEPMIFGKPNDDYIRREIEWYKSLSRNVNDIPGGPPEIWKKVASKEGLINSNYGWCIWSEENHTQYMHVRNDLFWNPNSRRAVMIYTRPTMHDDFDVDGMSDFMCTNAVQYLIRDNRLCAVVQMRSNDVVFGYRNDYAWQRHVQDMLLQDLNMNRAMKAGDGSFEFVPYELGPIIWQVGSLHVYERHFKLIE